MEELNDLIDFWREFKQQDKNDNIHPRDREAFNKNFKKRIINYHISSYEDAMANYLQQPRTETNFHTSSF